MAIRYDGALQIRAKAGDSGRILAAALEAVCIRRFGTLRSKRPDSPNPADSPGAGLHTDAGLGKLLDGLGTTTNFKQLLALRRRSDDAFIRSDDAFIVWE